MTEHLKYLPPLIIHDGSKEALHAAKVMLALCPASVEVIDLTTSKGQKRIDFINRGLLDGTLDTLVPPLVFALHPEAVKEKLRARKDSKAGSEKKA